MTMYQNLVALTCGLAAAQASVDWAAAVSDSVAADAQSTALLEPDTAKFYPLLGNESNRVRAGEPYMHLKRLRNTTFDEFAAYMRKGQPLIVEDVARGWPLKGWRCDDFSKAFPTGNMKAEYTSGGSGRAILGNDQWIHQPRSSGQDTSRHPDRAESAPYIWHVKDEEPLATKRKMQALYRAPYFLQDVVNRQEFNDSMEIWFSPGAAGAMAHADSYCELTWSVQLHGSKRWRMMTTLPPIPSVFDRFVYFDAGIYEADKWAPDYEFVVPEGAGVVFPPGNFHETTTARDTCTTATTVQMQLPNPTRYIRNFLPRLLSSHLGIDERCWDRWDGYATMQPRGRQPRPSLEPRVWREEVRAKGALLDTDGDGAISRSELLAYFNDPSPRAPGAWARTREHWYSWPVPDGERASFQDMMGRMRALDTLAYHDMDEDGSISPEELYRATVAWHAVRHKMLATHRLLTIVLRARGRDRLEAIQALVAMEIGYKRMFAHAQKGARSGDNAGAEAEAEAEAEVAEMRRKAFQYLQRDAPSGLAEENDFSGSAAAKTAMDEAMRAFVEPRKLHLKLTRQEQVMLGRALGESDGGSGGEEEEEEDDGEEEEERHGDDEEDGDDEGHAEL